MSHASVVKPGVKPGVKPHVKPPAPKTGIGKAEMRKPAEKSRATLGSLRHQLLTPLNHIVGYAEMLLEDAPESGYSSAGQQLRRIRETARELARFIDAHVVPRHGKAPEKILTGLRHDLAAPLHTIMQAVGAITSDPLAPEGDDVMKIGRAAAELFAMVHQPSTNLARIVPTHGKLVVRRRGELAREIEPGRILIVDDNSGNRELLARRLKRQGHRVTEAASGAEALERLVATPQDVVVLDLLMPKLDGFQVLEKIKADPALTGIPVIVVSALDELPGVVRSLESGAEDYLFKPIDPALLGARIASSLEKKRLRDLEKRRGAELYQAREQVRMGEQRLRLALKAAHARAWEWDLASDRVRTSVDRTLEEALAQIHADDRERVRERLFQAVEDGAEFHEQMRVARRDGSMAWVESFGTLRFDAQGRPECMIGLTRDITRQKQMDEDLRRAGRFQQFALAASRDLQEPLRAVSRNLAPLASRLEGEDARTLAAAVDSLGRMSKLVADVLRYSQASPAPARKRIMVRS
jgi:CheY-like chemotaxis protein